MPFLVQIDRTKTGKTLLHGADAMVVAAESSAEAIQMAAARYGGDGRVWQTDAVATAIATADDWEGWTFGITILSGFGEGDAEPASVTYVGEENDDADAVGAALVTLLNAIDGIANAAYNDTTNVLTIAGTADGVGDQTVVLSATPPGGVAEVNAVYGTLTHEGDAGDALTVALPGDDDVIPTWYSFLKQVE